MSEIRNNVIAGGVGATLTVGSMVCYLETTPYYMPMTQRGRFGSANVKHYRKCIAEAISKSDDAFPITAYRKDIDAVYDYFFKRARTWGYIAAGALAGVAIYNIGKNWFGDK